MRSERLIAVLATVVLAWSCTSPAYEADDPGECSDAADNDLDGLFDCMDPDCFGAPVCQQEGYVTEANLFDELPQGEAQMVSLCSRLEAGNVQSVVRDAFCGETRPEVTDSEQLLDVLGIPFDGPGGKNAQMGYDGGNPAWTVAGHSASLSRRLINSINPRVIVHTPALNHLDPVPGFVATAFVRGEGFAEIITHDPVRDDLDFFLFRFDYRCSGPSLSFWDPEESRYFERTDCTDEERFSEQYESGWSNYTVYAGEDLENTILDCLPCHESGLRTSPTKRKSLLMFQLNSMWMHWLYDNHHFFNWTENPLGMGPFHAMLQQYIAAHATEQQPLGETFGGIPRGALYASRPKALEDLVTANGYGNGFDNTAYDPNGSENGLLDDMRALGMFSGYGWKEMYALNLNGLMITPPGRGEVPFDTLKLAKLIQSYGAYRRGETTEFPDITDVYAEVSLAAVGLRVHPGLSAPEILVHACSQCHHDGLNQEFSRSKFQIGSAGWRVEGSDLGDYFGTLTATQLGTVQDRINLPEDHLRVMPPGRLRSLDPGERATVTEWLDTLIAGWAMEDDLEPPLPVVAEFDLLPSPAGSDHGEGALSGGVWNSMMPNTRTSVVTMRALPGVDPGGYVEYYFEETGGEPGGDSSGWQLSPRYLDTDLVAGGTYSYRVKMRDRHGNEGAFSEEAVFAMPGNWLACAPVPLDSDCDTVPDVDEYDGDTDGDGIIDILDPDDDGDDIATQTEVEDAAIYGDDSDGDGKVNRLDTNSDNDVFTDLEEGGGYRPDGNPFPGYMDPTYPCGNGHCEDSEDSIQETCAICPEDCGECG